MTERAWYVYGIVAADDVPGIRDLDVLQRNAVELTTADEVGAVVAPVDPSRPIGRRADLVAHSEVLNGIAEAGMPVVPVAFGSVLADLTDVRQSFLGANPQRWREMLDRLRGRRQFTLRATYREDVVLGEIVRSNPEIARLHELTAGADDSAYLGERVRLGELVSHALDDVRATDIDRLAATLVPCADEHRVTAGKGTDGLADAAFLVSDAQRTQFEASAEHLAQQVHDRIRLRLLGPLAAFDFVGQEPAWAS